MKISPLAILLNDKFRQVTVKGSKNRFRDLCYIDDVVNVTIQSIDDCRFDNEIFNVGTGKKTTVQDIISNIKKNLSISKKVKYIENTLGDQHGIYANVKKIKNLYKFKFIDFDQGLKKMIEWAKTEKKN